MITNEFRQQVAQSIIDRRELFGGTARDYANSLGINASVLSRILGGEVDKLLSDSQWLQIGRLHNIGIKSKNWKVARTQVYETLESDLTFCKLNHKSMILVERCGIGKTFCARDILSKMKNGFYIDCSQVRTPRRFIRLLARAIGVENTGRYEDVYENAKYALNLMEDPIVCLDEAGDLPKSTMLELKGLWNGTEGHCAWFMMGADGLRKIFERSIERQVVGYAELLSRFSDDILSYTPVDQADQKEFLLAEAYAVAIAQGTVKTTATKMARKCLSEKKTLRYLDTLIAANR